MSILTMQWKSEAQRKARLYLDGAWWMTLEREVLENLGLQDGMELSDEERDQIARRIADEKAKLFVLRSLSARPQTRAELERKLKSRETSDEAAKRALDFAEEYGLVDDAEVARGHARGLKERGYWRGRARTKLREKGVEQTLADEILEEMFDRDEELDAALRALKGRRVSGELKEMKRNIDFLIRRGFSYGGASGAMRQRLEEQADAEALDEGRDGTSA